MDLSSLHIFFIRFETCLLLLVPSDIFRVHLLLSKMKGETKRGASVCCSEPCTHMQIDGKMPIYLHADMTKRRDKNSHGLDTKA